MVHKIEVKRVDPKRDSQDIAKLIKICRMERRTVVDHYTAEEEQKFLENLRPRDGAFVAHVDEKFAGFASVSLRWHYSERLQHCGEGATWVIPEFRHKGVGTTLWRKGILPWGQKMGFKHIGFFVMAHNKTAIAFYERLGFRVCGYHRRLVKWDEEYLDAVEMEMWVE
ncbi:MAG: GNAT family N-acetyltransferase [Promethearchaeota archaeon]